MKHVIPSLVLAAVLALTIAACDSSIAPEGAAPDVVTADAVTADAFSKNHKIPVCHVGTTEEGALKVDLLQVPANANHLGNPAHSYEDLTDYEPTGDVGAEDATEDTDGNGIDDGCEIPVEEPCPCWDDPAELIEVEPYICSVNEPGHRYVFGGNEEGAYNLEVRNDLAVPYCSWDSTNLGNTYETISPEQFDKCYADLAPYCDQD